MAAAVACYRLKHGEPIGTATDQLECCCPMVREFMIALNDSHIWDSSAYRTRALMPFVPRLIDTNDPALKPRRLFLVADCLVRKILPFYFKQMQPDQPAEMQFADTLAQLAELVDQDDVAEAKSLLQQQQSECHSWYRSMTLNMLMSLSVNDKDRAMYYFWYVLSTMMCPLTIIDRHVLIDIICELVDGMLKLSENQTPAAVS